METAEDVAAERALYPWSLYRRALDIPGAGGIKGDDVREKRQQDYPVRPVRQEAGEP